MPMRTRRLRIGHDLGLQLLGLVLLTSVLSAARSQDALGIPPEDDLVLELPKRSAAAKQLANERYQMLKSIQTRMPGFRLGRGGFFCTEILFPLGRSDRAYTLELPPPPRDEYEYRITCFQRKDKEVKLVYRVDLKERRWLVTKRRPAHEITRVESLLDYLMRESVTLEGHGLGSKEEKYASTYTFKRAISKFARADLASVRGGVLYGVQTVISTLYVSRFLGGVGKGNETAKDEYFIESDPDTKVKLDNGWYLVDNDRFFRKYGLPAAKAELPLLDPVGSGGSRPAGVSLPSLMPVRRYNMQ